MTQQVTLKDKEVYKKMKYSCSHKLMYTTDTHIAVELEFISSYSNYHLQCPFEHEFKKAEEKNDSDFLSFWGKYRKWQKRKLYTKEDFNNLFEPLDVN